MAKRAKSSNDSIISVDYGKISRILSLSMSFHPPTDKCTATMTVITIDGKQHTFSANVLNEDYRDQLVTMVQNSLRGQALAAPSR